jgi:hypothetical protein
MSVDTSPELVERLATIMEQPRGPAPASPYVAATLRALAAERDGLLLQREGDHHTIAKLAEAHTKCEAENARMREVLDRIAKSDPMLFGGGPIAGGYHTLRRIARAALNPKPRHD